MSIAAGATTAASRATGRAPPPLLLSGIALAGCVAAAVSAKLALDSDLTNPGIRAALIDWITLPYILAGLIAWWRRPDSRLGALMIAGGFAIFLSSLNWTGNDLFHTVGQLFDVVPAAIFLHVYLAFPTGRLRSDFERALVCAAYAAAIVPQIAKMMLGYGSDHYFVIWNRTDVAQTIEQGQLVAISAMCLAGIGVLAARRRAAGPPLRRSLAVLVDCFALGLVMIAALFLIGAFQWPEFETIQRTTLLIIGLSPIAFLIALVSARLARSSVGDLMIALRADPAPADLRDALAKALRDPSLTLAYWLPEFDIWADLDGNEIDLEAEKVGRVATVIERDGAPVAALIHDPALTEEPELLDAVGAAAGIALENARLQAELAARIEELKGSRSRVLDAGLKERQRLERNLHDGAQARLVALSLELKLLERDLAANPAAQTRLDVAQREIALSLDELRDIARGIHPAVLTGHGLAVALEQVAVLAPVRVRLAVEVKDRLPEPVEAAAYYVVTESLANVAKHAHASAATVEVRREGGMIVVEVVDDGVGGADSERGSGIRGLADRVEALGGTLRIWTPQGGGTRVRAEIPCE